MRLLATGDGVQQHEHQLNSLAVLIPACLLLVSSAVLLLRARTASALLQLVGAGFLTVVLLTHICEAFDLVPLMHASLPIWCGWVGASSRRHMLNAVEATRRALRGGLKVATAATLLELIMLESTSKLKALTGFHVEPWVEGEEGAQE